MDSNRIRSELSDHSFDGVIQREPLIVLVEFWAPWSGNCHIMSPILDAITESMGAQIKVVRMNIENGPRTTNQFNVSTLPTFLMFRQGQLVESLSGTMSREELAKRIGRILDESKDATQ